MSNTNDICNFIRHKISNKIICNSSKYELLPELHLLVKKLILINVEQWELEDEIRESHINAGHFIEIKKNIDVHNLDRVSTISQIDDYFMNHEIQNTDNINISEIFCNTETLGEIIDKLIILSLKEYHLSNKEESEIKLKKVELLTEKFEFITNIFHELRENLSKGEACVLPNIQVKIYHKQVN